MARRALSLHARQLLAASLGLVAFLGFTGVALDEAFRQTAISSLHERLEQHAYAYLGDFEFTRDGELIEPPSETTTPPTPSWRCSTPPAVSPPATRPGWPPASSRAWTSSPRRSG